MTRKRWASITLCAAVVLALFTPGSAAAAPLDLSGELDGVAYEIRVPDQWSGTLVMYAHGYRDAADHPGEPDNRSASAFTSEATEQALLDAGYAIAGSAYASNGWAVRDGIHDTLALQEHFVEQVGQPSRTLIAGFSMGSVVAFESVERFPGVYDGALPSCAVGAGASRAWDGTLAVTKAYAAVFGWPAAWGSPGNMRDDVDFESEVVPVLAGQLQAPGGAAKFEFIRLAAGVPKGPEWPFSVWFFSTEGRAELERRAGGSPVQNLDHTYRLSEADRAYLAGIGLDGSTVDGYLAGMSAERVAAETSARTYTKRYADYTGKLRRPVLALHTSVDALVPPAHISAYTDTVAAAGRSELLAKAWTSGVGHCNFTTQQQLTAVQALDAWVDSGQPPGPLPADQGFVDVTPPPWPQP